MKPLQLAVVGVGSLGQHHARILADMDGVDLVGVVDPRPQQGQQIADRFGTTWHDDFRGLPSSIDGVVIATPTIYHRGPAEHFLQAGVATLVEKPLAANLDDACHLHQLAEDFGTTLQVGHVERFNPAFEEAQARCGELMYVRCQRASPYTFRSTDIGVVHDLMIHDIDLVLPLFGRMPTSVESFGAVVVGPHEDTAMARLRMANNAIVDITSSRMAPEAERSMQIWGTHGCLHVDLQTRQLKCWRPSSEVFANPGLIQAVAAATPNPLTLKDRVFGEWIVEDLIQANDRDALTAELLEFTAAIRGDVVPRVSGRSAVEAMQVADSVLTSLTTWSWQSSLGSDRAAA